MTESKKELLIKDLCGRLPYKQRCKDIKEDCLIEIDSIDIDGFVMDIEGVTFESEDLMPYLFPLSSMTEEQKEEYQKLRGKIWSKEVGDYVYSFDTIESIDWLNKNHFDFRNLIGKGLGIDASKVNV